MIFPRIEIHAVDHCTLSCVGCNHGSPLLSKKIYKAQDYFVWLDILRNKGCDWNRLAVSGGEPFILSEKINDFIVSLKKRYNCHIELFSNAFWLSDENCFDKYRDCFSNLDELILSFYPPYVEKMGWEFIQNKVSNLRNKFKLKISSFQNQGVKNFGQFVFLEKSVPTTKDLKCAVKDCTQLRSNGIMYRCTYGHYVNTVVSSEGFKNSKDIFLDLNDKKNDKNAIERWRNCWPLDSCSFCGCGQGRISWSKWESDSDIKNMTKDEYNKKVNKLISNKKSLKFI